MAEGPDRPRVSIEDGAVTVQNPCLSGGAIEVFLEPVLPAPRVLVVGDSPIAAARRSLGAELGLDVVAVAGAADPAPGDLALVVAAHGRDELRTLRRGLESGVPYVGLVASRKRGAAVLEQLRGDGVAEEQLARIDARPGSTSARAPPAEIALSILARIVAVRAARRALPRAAPRAGCSRARAGLAVDPICGMTVAVAADTPSLQPRARRSTSAARAARSSSRRSTHRRA